MNAQTCICGQEFVDDRCPKCYSGKPDHNLFTAIRGQITPSLELDVQIKHVAQNIFEFIDKMRITRGRPRQGCILACIYYAALHLGYVISVSELFMKSDIEQSHITKGIKQVVKILQSCFIDKYDIAITFKKHIRKFLLNITHLEDAAPSIKEKSEDILRRSSWIVGRLNDDDYFIDLAANTRCACALWLCLPPDHNLQPKIFCTSCNLSITTFNKKMPDIQRTLKATGILVASNFI